MKTVTTLGLLAIVGILSAKHIRWSSDVNGAETHRTFEYQGSDITLKPILDWLQTHWK